MGTERKNIKIIVATHKRYEMPKDRMYIPLHVGAEGKDIELPYEKDNSGENISYKNGNYCELTGLYWAWKNLDADYIGLVHYRRHFGKKKKKDRIANVLSYEQLLPLTKKYDVFVPKKRNYYIETLYSHYAHTHYIEQLDKTREIIAEKYAEYLPYFDASVKKRSGYMFNMMIMKKELIDSYCTWLFDILGALECEIDDSGLSDFQKRFYGRISEIIFNAWLEYQKKNGIIKPEKIKELPYMHIEKVNWMKKGFAFIKAKIFHKKYEGSF